jgi:acetamidase/formamidase
MLTRSAQVIVALFMLAVGGVASGQANDQANNQATRTPDLTGNWIGEVSPAGVTNGSTDYARISLQQSGNNLAGTLGRDTVSGSVKPNGEFDLELWGQTYTGTVKGETLTATAKTDSGPLQARFYRDKFQQSPPRTHVFEPKEFHRLFSGSIAPALKINPGDTVKTWTIDAMGYDAKGVRRSAGGNPQTGPFYVEGALPGDTVAIHLIKIQTNRDTAVTSNTLSGNAFLPGYYSSLGRGKNELVIWQLDRAQGIARLAKPNDRLKNFSVPLRPFLGCVGVAPADRMAFRTGYLGSYGGNLDYNRLTEGSIVNLPVSQVGALIFIGDGHAAQGDGELAGNALETSLDVEFRVELIRGASMPMPRSTNAEFLMASGISGSLNEAMQSATTNLARWLQEDYKLDRYDLSAVLGTALSYDIGEVVDPQYHVVARLSRKTVEGIAR